MQGLENDAAAIRRGFVISAYWSSDWRKHELDCTRDGRFEHFRPLYQV